MPILPVTIITTAVCDICGGSRTNSHTQGDQSGTATLRRSGWIIPMPGERVTDTAGRGLLAVCPSCAGIVRIINPAIARAV